MTHDIKGFASVVLSDLQDMCHMASHKAGWWHHPNTGLPYIPGDDMIGDDGVQWHDLRDDTKNLIVAYWPFVIATKIALVHSEVSEALEAHRRGLHDDKLAHRLGLEVELADAMIRQFDVTGAMEHAAMLGVVDPRLHTMDIGRGFFEKMNFNVDRPDHKIAVRTSVGGKAY